MCFSFVDQKNRLIPFRLMPVKLASLVQHGTIQGSVNKCSDTAMECGTVWQDSKQPLAEERGTYTPLTLYVAGMEGMGIEV